MQLTMIATVGGTPQPLIESIVFHQPTYVIFYCSHDSVDKVAEIKRAVAEKQGFEAVGFRDHKVLVEDVNDLVHCYERAQDAIARIKELRTAANDVIVDYTGGTKTMTLAIGLAGAAHGFSFSYVGGSQRTKGGLGVVIDGTEEIRTGVNPWSLFAVEERRLVAELFNHSQFTAAQRLVKRLLSRPTVDTRLRSVLRTIELLCVAYEKWDSFAHAGAVGPLKSGIQELQRYLDLGGDRRYESLLASASETLACLQKIQFDTKGFQIASQSLVADLIANADRRSGEGRFDDGVARLYRALEMAGQVALAQPPLKIADASDVPVEKIPESIRSEFDKRYRSDLNGKIQLPLLAVFRLLAESGHQLGLTFMQNKEKLDGVLSSRNSSILAHGLTPIHDSAYASLKTSLLEWLEQPALVQFPRMPD
jgi:CRISPR-associated protein (TIGR02710 family)